MYRGQRIRFSGYVKTRDVAAWSGLWLSIFGPGGGVIFNSNVQQGLEHNLRVVGTQDWQRYEVIVDVPQESSRINFGVGLMGAGQIWLDDVEFAVVGGDVPTTV